MKTQSFWQSFFLFAWANTVAMEGKHQLEFLDCIELFSPLWQDWVKRTFRTVWSVLNLYPRAIYWLKTDDKWNSQIVSVFVCFPTCFLDLVKVIWRSGSLFNRSPERSNVPRISGPKYKEIVCGKKYHIMLFCRWFC